MWLVRLAALPYVLCPIETCCGRSSLARRRLQLDGGLARSFSRARVRARTLTASRQSLAMASTPVAAQVHQALDIHGNLAAQVALDRNPRDFHTKPFHVRLRQILDL